MSGGVDSSVVAALMTEKNGKENVFGVTMRLFCYAEKSTDPKSCCSIEYINDAKAVCERLGIKHYVIDYEEEFEKEVIENFVSEYEAGRTPNPCVRCNTIMKFDYLLEKVKEYGADRLATGHYVIAKDEKLFKGVDTIKDQSYFLYGITPKQLEHTLFPLGEYTKDKVRDLARKYGLKTAEKTESQEICFIEGSYHDFLEGKLIKVSEGDITDSNGKVLGKHKGTPYYTIGQRKGLGIASEKPLYVIDLNVKDNTVIVGEEEELDSQEFEVKDLNWINEVDGECSADVAIRYNMEPQPATIQINGDKVKVTFNQPQKAITRGQSAVFYNDNMVLGGGIIV